MALNQEKWYPICEEVMWANNDFYMFSRDDTSVGAVFANKIHVPNAGAFTNPVHVDNMTWPLTAYQRTDIDNTYDAHTFSTDPEFVNLVEVYEFNYPKIVSIVTQMTNALNDMVGQYAIFNWVYGLPMSSILQSTGVARNVVFGWQSGTRNSYQYTDFVAGMAMLELQNVPRKDRAILVSAAGYSDLMNLGKYQYAFIELGKLIQSGQLNGETASPSLIGKFLGADVYLRGNFGVCFNNQSATGSTYASGVSEFIDTGTTAASASDFCLIWQKSKVCQWRGTKNNSGIQIFERLADPFYNSDIMSAVIRHGSARVRANNDNYGVIQLVEAIA